MNVFALILHRAKKKRHFFGSGDNVTENLNMEERKGGKKGGLQRMEKGIFADFYSKVE